MRLLSYKVGQSVQLERYVKEKKDVR